MGFIKADEYQRIEIRQSNKEFPMYTEVLINGNKVGVKSYKLEQHAGGIPTLTLELNALNISTDLPSKLFLCGYEDNEVEIKFKRPSEDGQNN